MDPLLPPSPAGPPPFRFQPSAGRALRGPAFSLPFKVLATLLVFGSLAWLLRLMERGLLGSQLSVNVAWFLAALAMMLWTWWAIVRSTTGVDDRQIHQTWVCDKRMELADLATAKLMRVRGLEWLVAPRLYVRTLVGKMAIFYAADPAVVAEFERLAAELREFRALR